MKTVTDQQIIEVCSKHIFMSEAAAELGVHRNTLKSRAMKLGVYTPASRKHISARGAEARPEPKNKIPLLEILDGKFPGYPTNHLRVRMLREKIIENVCGECGITNIWNGKPITLELDHINGIRTDHRRENLRILCPNCHSQTPTFKSKNNGKNK